MKPGQLLLAALFAVAGLLGSPAQSLGMGADKVVAVVNTTPILESTLQQRMAQARASLARAGRPAPDALTLRRQILDRLINDEVLVQRARLAGIVVEDNMLDRAVERIADQNGLTPAALRSAVERDGIAYKQFREDLRQEITLSRLREDEVEARLRITEAELDAFLAQRQQVLADVQEVRLEQLLLPVALVDATQQAEALRLSAGRGESLEALASKVPQASYSDLGWRPVTRLPDLFVKAIEGVAQGQVAPVVQSPAGLHVLKVTERRDANSAPLVDRYRSRHILLPVAAQQSEATVRRRADEIRRRILGGEDFAALARAESKDGGSAAKGGELPLAFTGDMVPEFERAALELKPGEISQPVRSQFGYHVIQLLERTRVALPAERQRQAARLALRDQRMAQAMMDYTRDLRANTFVDIRDPDDALVSN